MNLNEECLLHFLKDPNHLQIALEEFKKYIFSNEAQSSIKAYKKDLIQELIFDKFI